MTPELRKDPAHDEVEVGEFLRVEVVRIDTIRDRESVRDLPDSHAASTDAEGRRGRADAAQACMVLPTYGVFPVTASVMGGVGMRRGGRATVVVLPSGAERFVFLQGKGRERIGDRNTATRPFSVVPIVGAPAGSGAGTLRSITVASSTDVGATWRDAPVPRGPYGATVALVRHHGAGRFVSLRVNATRTAGNTAEQTIVRAFRFADPAVPGRTE